MQNTPLFWTNTVKLVASICRDHRLASSADIKVLINLAEEVSKRDIGAEAFYQKFGTFLERIDTSVLYKQFNTYLQYQRFDTPFLYAMSAENLTQVINDLNKNQGAIFGGHTQFKGVVKGKFVLTSIVNKADYFSTWHYIFDMFFSQFLFVCRAVAGKTFDVQQLVIPTYRKQSNIQMIQSASSANIEFSGNNYQFGFNKNWLEVTSYHHNPTERSRLEVELDQRKAIVRTGSSFSEKVMAVVKQVASPANVTLALVSEELGISESHARKKLADENTSFKYLCKWWLLEEAISKLLNSETKIDAIAIELGYSERAPFERAFKSNLGMSPSQFRELSFKFGHNNRTPLFRSRVEALPPLPSSCRRLIQLSEEQATLDEVVNIVESDPVFIGRLLGLASRAVFGARPKNLKEAIGRNLGIEKVRQLALIFSAKDLLGNMAENLDVTAIIKATIISQMIYIKCQKQCKFIGSQPTDDYVLSMGLLGLLLMFHRDEPLQKELSDIYNSCDNFADFMFQTHATLNVSVYKVSGLMLAVWGVNETVIKELTVQGEFLKGKGNSDSRYLYRVFSNAIAINAATASPLTSLDTDVFESVYNNIEVNKIIEYASQVSKSIGEFN